MLQKITVVLLLSLSLTTIARAQDTQPEHIPGTPGTRQVYGQLSTLVLANSLDINYEKIRHKEDSKFYWGFRAGIGTGYINTLYAEFIPITLPLSAKMLYGTQQHFLVVETGAYLSPVGFRLGTGSISPTLIGAWPIANVGYRYYSKTNPSLFQATLGVAGLHLSYGYIIGQ